MFVQRCLLVIGISALLQSCAQIDDYLLGKDNTIKPKSLSDIHATPLKKSWTANIGPMNQGKYLKLRPTISGSTLYAANSQGRVLAIDKTTGHTLWTREISHGLVSGPTVSHQVLAVGTNNAQLLVLSPSDGHELWRASVAGDILASPLITKNLIVVKTIDGHVYAYDKLTGTKRWTVNHGAPHLILKASSSPVKADQWILVGFSDGKLDAIDVDSGTIVWQRSIAYASGSSDVERLVDIDADPIVRNGQVYLASYQGYIGSMSLNDGQFIWNKPASTYKNLSLDNTDLFMSDSTDIVWAFNRSNGQVKWKQPALTAREITAPVLSHQTLFLGDKTGLLHGLNIQQGDLVIREQLSGPIETAPVVDEHHLYVLTNTGQLTCFSIGG